MRHLNRSLTALVLLYSLFIFSRVLGTVFVDGSASPGGDGTALLPFQTIQEGINAAQAGEDVSVAPGFYSDPNNTCTVSGVGLITAVACITKDVQLVASDPNPSNTVIHGGGSQTGVALDSATATLSGFTISNGLSFGPGAGIVAGLSDTTITNSVISGNQSNSTGGGIYLYGGRADISNSTISGNQAAFRGGGIALADYAYASISGSTISFNTAGTGIYSGGYYGRGGGIYARYSDLVLTGNDVRSNNANQGSGGGVDGRYVDLTLDSNYIGMNTAARSGGGVSTFVGTLTMTGNNVVGNALSYQYSGGFSGGAGIYAALTQASLDSDNIRDNISAGSLWGGGINGLVSTFAITNAVIQGNQAAAGGGISLAYYSGATVNDSTIQGNTAAYSGGGISMGTGFYYSYFVGDGSLQVNGGTIQDNVAGYGGGISAIGAASLGVDGTLISGNQASFVGGGIASYHNLETIQNATFYGNTSGGYGGGMASTYSVTEFTNNQVLNNSASGAGGGLSLDRTKATVTRNTFSSNVATSGGGGIVVQGQCPRCGSAYTSFVTLSNNLISGNSSVQSDGGGLLLQTVGYASVTNNTIVGNDAASYGGGVFLENGNSLYLANNIIDGNTAASGGGVLLGAPYSNPYPSQSPVVTANNLYGNSPNNWTSFLGDPTGTNGNISADPQFANAGAGDYALLPGSPSVDTGDNAAKGISGPDRAGAARIADGGSGSARIDMGAYEVPFAGINAPPVADAAARLAFRHQDQVRLDGTRSYDPDGDLLTFHWSQVGGPPAILDSDSSPSPRILSVGTVDLPNNGPFGLPGLPTALRFDLTVSDGKESDTARLEVRMADAGTSTFVDVAGYVFAHEFGHSLAPGGIAFSLDGTELLTVPEFFFARESIVSRAPVLRDPVTNRILGFGRITPDLDVRVPYARRLVFHPSGTLFLTDQQTGLSQVVPGGDPISIDVFQHGVGAPKGIAIVPAALPNGGELLIADIQLNQIIALALIDLGNGVYDVASSSVYADLGQVGVQPDGLTFVDAGGEQDLLVGDPNSNRIVKIDIDQATGLPVGGPTAPQFTIAYSSADTAAYAGLALDPLTNDVLAANPFGSALSQSLFTFSVLPLDYDADGVANLGDNCPTTPNPNQDDTNDNGVGDLCDNLAPAADLPPVADAGPAQSVPEGVLVTLDGSASLDPEGQALTYSWTQTSGVAAILSDPAAVMPTFSAPDVPSTTGLTFQLVVDDGTAGPSAPDTVLITVIDLTVDLPPVANAGPDQTVNEADLVTLNGSGSFDPEAAPLTFAWTQIGGTGVTLSSSTAVSPTFTAPVVSSPTSLTFQLIVDDGTAGPSSADTVVVTVQPVAADGLPAADAGPNRRGVPGSILTLDGSGSSDPEGAPLTYSWVQTGGPSVPPSNPGLANPTVNLTGLSPFSLLTYDLIVDDGTAGPSTADSVGVQVVPVPEWSQWRHDAANSGNTASNGPTMGGSAFNITLPAGVRSSVSFGADAMYVGADDGKLYAFGLDGMPLWEFPTGGNVRTTPLVLPDGGIVFGSFDNNLYAVNPDGTARWNFAAAGKFRFSSPAYYASANLIVAGSEDGKLHAVDATTGLPASWSPATTGGAVHSSPAVSSSGVAYFGSTDGKLRAIDLGSGTLLWETDLGDAVQSTPSLHEPMGYVYVGADDGRVHAVNASDGSISWSFQAGAAVTSSPAVDPVFGQLYFGSDDFNLYAVDLINGQEEWRYATGSYVRSSPSVGGAGMVYVGSCDGTVRAVDYDGAEVFAPFASSGLIIPSPTLGNDGLLYIGSDDRFVHAIGPDPFGLLPRPLAAPRLDELTPASGLQGETLELTLRGRDLSADLSLDLGAGIAITGRQLISTEEMRLTVALAAGSSTGGRNLLADRGTGFISSCLEGFTVEFDCRRADVTGDGMVDGLDLASLAARFGQVAVRAMTTDLNGDGRVDGDDLALLGAGFGVAAADCR